MIFRGVTVNTMRKKDNKKQLTDEEIEEIIDKKYSNKLPHTKDYIREQLKKDPNYICKFSMVREDFIEEARKVHSEKYNYDLVPEIIQNSEKTKISLICEEINPKTGCIYGKFETTFAHFVIRGQNIYLLGQHQMNRKKSRKKGEKFLSWAKNKFPNLDFSKAIYVSAKTDITIVCPLHGEYTITPDNFKKSATGGCRGCSNMKSRGERFVDNSLNKLGISYTPQYEISAEKLEIQSIRSVVYVDYYINLNGLEYLIEINGKQHYCEFKRYHKDGTVFVDQIKRDQAVRMYAGINGIIFVEIPYTVLTSEERVYDILKRILIDKEPVYKVIGNLPDYKFREEGQDE